MSKANGRKICGNSNDQDEEIQSTGLYGQLAKYGESDFYPFHMPGHKRQIRLFSDPYAIDITEIDGFDNLHHAEGILKEAQARAGRLYHAEETFYLVNGSTCGLLSAISASVSHGGTLLLARNSHKAAYHAVLLNRLQTEYLYPMTDMMRGIGGAIRPEQVREALAAHPRIEAVLITSPTYDGITSDVRTIAEIVHEAGAVLIVDEAHGAHFGMHPYFPENSVDCGADLVIHSLHKTLPSMTQTALLHVQGERVNRERLKRYLGIYQSSSPSYIFMAGMDSCIRLLEDVGDTLFSEFVKRLERLRADLSELGMLHLVTGDEPELYRFGFDRSKVLITTERAGISGAQLAEKLRRAYHLEMEMDAEHYVTAITTIADTDEGMTRLVDALTAIDKELQEDRRKKSGQCRIHDKETTREICRTEKEAPQKEKVNGPQRIEQEEAAGHPDGTWRELHPEAVMRIAQAVDAPYREVLLEESEGKISTEFVYLYPPGIPLIAPGERVTKGLLETILKYRQMGLRLQGMADYDALRLRVVKCGVSEKNCRNNIEGK